MDTVAVASFRRDAKVIGVIAVAHWASHFLQLALPPLFVFLKAEFDVSYVALGALTSAFFVTSCGAQFAAGFAVDRFGARPVLLAGTALLAAGTLLAGLVPGFAWLYVLATLMGIGNGVFHPADFAVLNARVESRRLGHAYSMHGVGGSLGYALAPLCSYALGSAFGWRTALIVMGAIGLGVLALLVAHRAAIVTSGHRGKEPTHAMPSMQIFRQRAVLLCFVFFCVYTVGGVAMQTFAAPALNAAYAIPMGIATSAVTGYLLGGAGGVFAGGFFVGGGRRPDQVAAWGLAAGALIIAIAALTPVPPAVVLPLFVLAGFALGSTGPSRDMLVRRAAPPGAAGRTYGFVYSGLDVGAMIAPVLAGSLLDRAAPRLVFVSIALFLTIGLVTVLATRRRAGGVAVAAASD